MMDSGLWYETGKGWYAKDARAIDYGSGYDPVYEAIKNGNYSDITSILSGLGQNSKTDISQEMVEDAVGLERHSACAITANAEYANDFFQSRYGVSLTTDQMLEVLKSAKGEMYDDEGKVLSYNGLDAMIGNKLGIDNYPLFEKEYENYGELQTAGIDSYMIKFFDVNNPKHNHFASSYNGVFDDPDTYTKNNRW